MFGNREMIDEASSNVIDEMDYDVVDDIKDEKRRGNYHAGHLCDEGQSFHEAADRQASSAYNSAPRTSSYPKPAQQASPRNTSPYPKPTMQQYRPAAAPRQERPVQSTIFNGRTYDRPAETPTQTPAMQKATKIFTILIVIGLAASFLTSFLMLPVCIILALSVMSKAKKCNGDDTSHVDRFIPTIVVVLLFTFLISCAGHSGLALLLSLFKETSDTGGY